MSAIAAALGLSRTRLAELLYEHEGFVDMKRGEGAPDREVPSWIEENLNARHSGDCTKECHSCLACHAKWALETWDEFEAMIVRALAKAPSDTPTVEIS